MRVSKTDKSQDSNRGLRMVVISMGMVLIGGTVLLFFMAFKKMNEKVISGGGKGYVPREYRECGEHTLQLAKDETLLKIEHEGVISRVTVSLADGNTAVRLVQSCTGEQLGSLIIKD